MKKRIFSKTMVLTSVLCLLPMIAYLAVWDRLPDPMPIHFDSAGAPDNYAPKLFAALGLPLILLAANVLVNFMTEADPRSKSAGREVKALSKWLVPVISVLMNFTVLFLCLGWSVNISVVGYALLGILLIILGNYLPKSKRNYTIGIKLPWTLNSDENWNRTHRLGGYVFIAAGALTVLNVFLNLWWLTLVLVALCVAVPTVYSFLLYQKGI